MKENIDICFCFPEQIYRSISIPKTLYVTEVKNILGNDPTLPRPKSFYSFIYEGNVLANNDVIGDVCKENSMLVHVMFDPILSEPENQRRSILFYNEDNDEMILERNAIDATNDVAFLIPRMVFEMDDNNMEDIQICSVSINFWIGFLYGLIGGPVSLIVLVCRHFDIVGLSGLFIGIICWFIAFFLLFLA